MKRIILIDGPYGIGKTTVAKRVVELSGEALECIDPDFYYNGLVEKNPAFILMGWPIQHNKTFIVYFRGLVEERLRGKEIIIPMSITTELCKTDLLDYFRAKTELIHIVLEADKESLLYRIECDSNRDKEFAINNVENCLHFIEKNLFEAVRINTSNRSVDEIADEIIKL